MRPIKTQSLFFYCGSVNYCWGVAFFLAAFSSAMMAADNERTVESSRFLGRGNTYVATFDSDESIRANPAALAQTEKSWQIRFLQLDMFVGSRTLDTINDLVSISTSDSAVDILNTFRDKFGQRQYGRFQVSPLSLRIGGFEISPFASTSNYVDLHSPTIPEVQFRSETFLGMAIGYGFSIGKEISLGLTLRPTHHTVYTGDISFADLVTFLDNSDFEFEDIFERQEGFPVATDIGMVWHPSDTWRLGLLVENTGYAGDFGDFNSPPPPVRQRLGLGTTYRMELGGWRWDWMMDFQDLLGPHHIMRTLHLGTELGTSYFTDDNDFGLLMGLNDGYFTTGMFVDLWLLRLNVTNYAVELGEYPGQRFDRRWAMTLSTGFSF